MSVLAKQADLKPSPRFTVTFGQVGKGDRVAVDVTHRYAKCGKFHLRCNVAVRPRSGRAVVTTFGEVEFRVAQRKVRSGLCQHNVVRSIFCLFDTGNIGVRIVK